MGWTTAKAYKKLSWQVENIMDDYDGLFIKCSDSYGMMPAWRFGK